MNEYSIHQPLRIIVVGGDAGGLELATRLGKRLGRKNLAEIMLIDANLTLAPPSPVS